MVDEASGAIIAVLLKMGRKRGKYRAERLTPDQRKEIATWHRKQQQSCAAGKLGSADKQKRRSRPRLKLIGKDRWKALGETAAEIAQLPTYVDDRSSKRVTDSAVMFEPFRSRSHAPAPAR